MPAIEEQQAMPSEEVLTPVGPVDGDVAGKTPSFFVSKRQLNLGENKNNALMLAGALGVAGIVGVFMLSHSDKPGAKGAQPVAQVTSVKPPLRPSGGYVPGDQASASTESNVAPATSASDVENTKNRSGDVSGVESTSVSGSTGSSGSRSPEAALADTSRRKQRSGIENGTSPAHSLNSVAPFQPPAYQQGMSSQNLPYAGSGGSTTEQARSYADEVTKPSMIFAAQLTSGSPSGGASSLNAGNASEPITNFGLEPGFHVSAHLEASVSTVGGTPAVAVVEYDCIQNGRVVIPAGSRVVGKIMGASSTGLVNMSFTEIYLPNGTRAPINAVGLDQYLHQIKGIVTGKNTAKQFIIASLASVGSLGAGFFGNNNSGTITQADLARSQVASNIGNAGDQAVQRLQVSQSPVVTVPSGTLMYVTFITAVRGSLEQAAGTQQPAR
jgi:type IV secretory pathway VirB10-like protein